MFSAALVSRFGTLDVQIHHDGILPASDDHCLAWHIRSTIDLLMRDIRRHVNEIASVRLIAELQVITPTHACATSDNVDHCFQLAMMVGAGFRVWLNDYRSGPQLTGSSTRVCDGGSSRHSGSLGSVGVKFRCANNLYAMRFPVQRSPPVQPWANKSIAYASFGLRNVGCLGRSRRQGHFLRSCRKLHESQGIADGTELGLSIKRLSDPRRLLNHVSFVFRGLATVAIRQELHSRAVGNRRGEVLRFDLRPYDKRPSTTMLRHVRTLPIIATEADPGGAWNLKR